VLFVSVEPIRIAIFVIAPSATSTKSSLLTLPLCLFVFAVP
jgi:hypothetical protein